MKKVCFLMTAALACMALSGCGAQTDGEAAAVQSVSALCGYGSSGTVDRFAGVISPQSQVSINKDENQTVEELKVEVGDEVSEGDVLFTYDAEEAELELERGKLELEQLKNSLTSKQAQKESLEKDKKSAGKDQQLSYSLEIQEAEADIQETNYNITLKQKEIEKLEASCSNLDVTSPINGVVSAINSSGETDDYGNAKAYITITETGSYRVKGYVNENNANDLYEGISVIIRSRLDNETIWHGTITSIDWEDPASASDSNVYYYSSDSSEETTISNKYPFYVELDNIEGLLLGQHVYIEPDYGQAEEVDETIVKLSSYYLCDTDSSAWVWAENKNGKLEKRKVTLGEYDEMLDSYIVESGLTVDDYIAFPTDELKEGMVCTEYDYVIDDMYIDDGSWDDGSYEMGYNGYFDEEGRYIQSFYDADNQYVEGYFDESASFIVVDYYDEEWNSYDGADYSGELDYDYMAEQGVSADGVPTQEEYNAMYGITDEEYEDGAVEEVIEEDAAD